MKTQIKFIAIIFLFVAAFIGNANAENMVTNDVLTISEAGLSTFGTLTLYGEEGGDKKCCKGDCCKDNCDKKECCQSKDGKSSCAAKDCCKKDCCKSKEDGKSCCKAEDGKKGCCGGKKGKCKTEEAK